MKQILKRIPWMLVWLRAALGPVIVIMAMRRQQGLPMAAVIVLALLSDIYDGILARRLGSETAVLRRADSAADTLFYACAAWAAWILARSSVRSVSGILAGLIAVELLRYVFDFVKFGREASYHAYSAKAWGLVLACALILLLAYNVAGRLLEVALWLGILTNIEGLAISMILPVWTHDVRSVFHAARLRVSAGGANAATVGGGQ